MTDPAVFTADRIRFLSDRIRSTTDRVRSSLDQANSLSFHRIYLGKNTPSEPVPARSIGVRMRSPGIPVHPSISWPEGARGGFSIMK